MPIERRVRVNGHELELSSVGKVLFPESGITKGELIDYYRRIARVMIPHIKDHPVTMQRFPGGIGEAGFYHKQMPDYFPDWIRSVKIEVLEDGEIQDQVLPNDAATLVYLANQYTITMHVWLSRADRLRDPDRMIFDLDPPSDFEASRSAAFLVKEVLDELGLTPYVMTTGSRGLHVVTPLDRSADFEATRDFARDLAQLLADQHPQVLTTEMRKSEREGRLFLDYVRNGYAATAVAPYAVRAKEGAPVAAPLRWDEVQDPDLRSNKYTIRNIFDRLDKVGDPWQGMMRHARSLEVPRRKLDAMLKRGA